VVSSQNREYARQITEVTQSHFMPPWPPARAGASFLRERKPADSQIGLIEGWVSLAAPLRQPGKVPATAAFPRSLAVRKTGSNFVEFGIFHAKIRF
jgi:hypothetical protein